mmetsp:Transcript_23489/g.75931  ORF Transcript_23489/g.75931 Transcript_23489/m.75931 type:complete len:210 (-) Transcript_23489:267-896(-)
MSSSLSCCVAACSDSARRTRGASSASRMMRPAEPPTVETVIRLAPRSKSDWWVMPRRLLRTASRLSRGSPIPMKTTLRTSAPPSSRTDCRACQTCSRISAADSCANAPIVPVAQKEHWRPHPTWEETQTVQRCRPVDRCSCMMSTVSTRRPEASSTTSLRPPADSTRSTTRELQGTKAEHMPLASCRGRPASECSASAVNAPPRRKRWR